MNRCLDCQFLSKLTNILATDESIPAPWSANERKQGHLRCGSIPMCAHGVWDTRIDPDLDAELEVNKQRGNSCYFLEVHKGMSFTAGRDLLKRRSEIARHAPRTLDFGIVHRRRSLARAANAGLWDCPSSRS